MKAVFLLLLFTVLSVVAIEESKVCAGTEEYTFEFDKVLVQGIQSWHYSTKSDYSDETDFARYLNGVFSFTQYGTRYEGRVTLVNNTTASIILHNVTVEDSGYYRFHTLDKKIKLIVKDPCISKSENELKCATTTSTNEFRWEVDGNVLEEKTSTIHLEKCIDDDQRKVNKTYKCILPGGMEDQMTVTSCEHAALSVGVIVLFCVIGVAGFAVLIGIGYCVMRRRASKGISLEFQLLNRAQMHGPNNFTSYQLLFHLYLPENIQSAFLYSQNIKQTQMEFLFRALG